MKKTLSFLLVGFLSASIALFIHAKMGDASISTLNSSSQSIPARFASLNGGNLAPDAFVHAAEVSTPMVVHITTKAKRTASNSYSDPMDLFNYFFGTPRSNPGRPQSNEPVPLGSGSGVIISSDGYIITNNHVIEGADEVEVVLNDNRSYTAKLIGIDPTTDLAVVKIDIKNAPFAEFANSDDTKVGQWVLAVGNPFNLASTVTAGIISAKARNINILKESAGNLAVESFIQTDAAVNPGNSGGALVDLNGNLIGINSAIASPSGVYAGYAFAIPSNLVKKVINDIVEFGVVQRGFLGVSIGQVDDKTAKELGLDKVQGAFVSEVNKNSGAEEAGIKSGDIITRINEREIKSSPELQEMVARYRPGDKIQVQYIRDGKEKTVQVTLKGKNNSTKLATKEELSAAPQGLLNELGLELEEVSGAEAKKMGIQGGLRVKKLLDGVVKENTNIKEGFVITGLNNRHVTSLKEVEELLKRSRGEGVLIQGKYPNENGSRYYAFGF
jgi:Do/DeqQ family serine protease